MSKTGIATVAKERNTRLHVLINPSTYLQLRDIAERKEISFSEVIRQAIGTLFQLEEMHARGAEVKVYEADSSVRTLYPSAY